MPLRTKRSRQSGTARTGKKARHASPPTPQPELQPPINFEYPSTSNAIERPPLADLEEDASAHAQAVASEEIQNALDRAEEEAFSNSESEADSACCSIFGAWSDSDGDASSSELEPEDGDDLPLAVGARAGFTFQNLTTEAEWKTAEARLPGNKWTNPSTTSRALCMRKRREDERIEKKRKKLPSSTKHMVRLLDSLPVPPHPTRNLNNPRCQSMLRQETSQPRASATRQISLKRTFQNWSFGLKGISLI